MQPFPAMGYDRAITVFSPEGRLYQVEYAREAVKRGTTSIGIKFKDGVILIVDKRVTSKLIEPRSIEKIFQIDDHIGAVTSGLVADGRVLIDRARIEAQVYRLLYNEEIDVELLAKRICDYKQVYTQHGGVRPFGISLLIAGVSGDTPRLFETDPSGALLEYKATAIGIGRETCMELFEKEYKDNMTKEEAIILGLKALDKVTDGKISEINVEIAIIEPSGFKKLSQDEIKRYIEMYKKIKEEKKE